MGRGRRSRWRAGVGLVALLALAGCGAVPPGVDDPGRTPAPTGASGQPATTPPSSGTDDAADEPSTSAPSQPRADLGYRMPRLGPGDAPGMVARLAAMAAPDFAVVVRWATPGGRHRLRRCARRPARRPRARHGGRAWDPLDARRRHRARRRGIGVRAASAHCAGRREPDRRLPDRRRGRLGRR